MHMHMNMNIHMSMSMWQRRRAQETSVGTVVEEVDAVAARKMTARLNLLLKAAEAEAKEAAAAAQAWPRTRLRRSWRVASPHDRRVVVAGQGWRHDSALMLVRSSRRRAAPCPLNRRHQQARERWSTMWLRIFAQTRCVVQKARAGCVSWSIGRRRPSACCCARDCGWIPSLGCGPDSNRCSRRTLRVQRVHARPHDCIRHKALVHPWLHSSNLTTEHAVEFSARSAGAEADKAVGEAGVNHSPGGEDAVAKEVSLH